MLQIKRVYAAPAESDGHRILVDRLWPRGLTREKARVDEWLKDIAPSPGLRKWFGHQPEKWSDFQDRYKIELRTSRQLIMDIAKRAKRSRITLVYGARDEQRNGAVVLAQVIRAVMRSERENAVDEILDESFPASDPPPWTLG